jgi:uncharacterized membrane protein
MKKNKNAFLIVVGVIAMLFWSSLAVSCISSDTAYRIGYDIGSSLFSYDGETLNPSNK